MMIFVITLSTTTTTNWWSPNSINDQFVKIFMMIFVITPTSISYNIMCWVWCCHSIYLISTLNKSNLRRKSMKIQKCKSRVIGKSNRCIFPLATRKGSFPKLLHLLPRLFTTPAGYLDRNLILFEY